MVETMQAVHLHTNTHYAVIPVAALFVIYHMVLSVVSSRVSECAWFSDDR
jgi:hypothetical protein